MNTLYNNNKKNISKRDFDKNTNSEIILVLDQRFCSDQGLRKSLKNAHCRHDCLPLVININGKFVISKRVINE